MPDAPLPPLPPLGQPRWRTATDELVRNLPLPPTAWVALAVAAVMGVVAFAALTRAQPVLEDGGAPPAVTPAAPEAAASPGGSRTTTKAEEVVVDVSGAVVRPGLVRLRIGARVADAVTAAGGPAADANLSAVNQARVMNDGEQVRVPREGEPAPAAPPLAGGAADTPPTGPTVPVDLNQATVAELDVLPGVGPATAAAIVSWREENGGFRRIDDLLEVPGIGPTRLERLRPHVRV